MVLVGTTFVGCVEICVLVQWVSCIGVGKVRHGLDSMLTGLALWMWCGGTLICYKLSSLSSLRNGIIFFFYLDIVKPCSRRLRTLVLKELKKWINKKESTSKSKDTLADLIFTWLEFFLKKNLQRNTGFIEIMTWWGFIGWRKTLVLRQFGTQFFLIQN